MMQWLNLTRCGLYSNLVSPVVHTLLPLVLHCLDSCDIEVLILILEKVLNCRYNLIISPILLPSQVCFLSWGTANSQMVPNQENQGDQPVQSHIHAQQPFQPWTCVQEHCPGETGLSSSVSKPFTKCLYYYFSNSWITYQLWVYLEGNNAVSIRKGWI